MEIVSKIYLLLSDGVHGTFSCSPDATFEGYVLVHGNIIGKSEILIRGLGGVRRSEGRNIIQTDRIGVVNNPDTDKNYLQIVGYNSNHIFGVDVWSSDKKLKKNVRLIKKSSRDLYKSSSSNSKVGLSLIKAIRHYSYDYKDKELGGHSQCGYIAQNLGKNNSDLIREVEQNDGSIVLEPIVSSILPNITLAIQEQQLEIDRLYNENKVLKERLDKIEKALGL